MSAKPWKPVALSGGIILALAILPVFLGLVYYGMDQLRVDLPYLCEFRRLLAGPDPLWISRSLGNGEPFFANPQSQAFYPVRWLQLLLTDAIGPSVSNAIHWSLAAAGAAYLALQYRIEARIAALAGMAFALSGTVIDLGIHTTYLIGAAYLPWIWGAARAQAARPGRGPLAVLVASATLCLLGSEPQTYFIGAGLVVLERAGLRAAIAYALAFGLAFVHWWPALVEFSVTRRSGGVPVAEALAWSFDPVLFAGTIAPDYLKDKFSDIATQTWNSRPYIGIVTVVFGLAACLRKPNRVPAIVLLGALVFALGRHTPVLPALSAAVPALLKFRYPAKYFLVVDLAVFLLAARAFQEIVSDDRTRRLALRIALGALGLTGLAMAVSDDSVLRDSLTHPALILVLAAGALALKSRWAMALPAIALLDALLIAPSGVIVGPSVLSTPPFQQNQAIAGLDGAVYCSGRGLYVAGLSLERQNLEVSFYSGMQALGYPNLNACSGIVSGTSYSVLVTTAQETYTDALSAGHTSAARASGCTHVIALQPPALPDTELVSKIEIYEQARRDHPDFAKAALPALFKIHDPVPEAFAARDPRRLDGLQSLYEAVSASRKAEEVTRLIDLSHSETLPDGHGVTGATVQWANSARATLRLEGTGGAVAGVRTRHAMGWRATQAGRELEVVRIAGVFLGAIVPDAAAGPVEFEYFPPRLKEAAVISLLSLLALGWVLTGWRPRRITPLPKES